MFFRINFYASDGDWPYFGKRVSTGDCGLLGVRRRDDFHGDVTRGYMECTAYVLCWDLKWGDVLAMGEAIVGWCNCMNGPWSWESLLDERRAGEAFEGLTIIWESQREKLACWVFVMDHGHPAGYRFFITGSSGYRCSSVIIVAQPLMAAF